jgi:glycosyltransferase involved in cell wall biosynthesis
MRTYAIDAHALVTRNPTGIHRYVRHLLSAMSAEPLHAAERAVLYASVARPAELALPKGWSWQTLAVPWLERWPRLQLGWEWRRHPPSVCFVPSDPVPRGISARTSVVTTIHDLGFRRAREAYRASARRRQHAAVAHAVRRADRLIAVSRATAHDLAELYRVGPERVAVTPLAPSLPACVADAAAIASFGLQPQGYFLFIGRREQKKNVALLVEAFGRMRRAQAGSAWQLVLVGGRGFGAREIDRSVAACGVAQDVLAFDYLPDDTVSALLAHALALVLPSCAEGFGIPVLEAMAAGVPAIISDTPALRETAGEAALVTVLNDSEALAAALQRIAASAELRASLAAAGREHVAGYSWTATARATWAVLRGV